MADVPMGEIGKIRDVVPCQREKDVNSREEQKRKNPGEGKKFNRWGVAFLQRHTGGGKLSILKNMDGSRGRGPKRGRFLLWANGTKTNSKGTGRTMMTGRKTRKNTY